MTAQHVAWLLLGVASGVASGYPWGRWNGKRALDRAWDDGWDWGREDGYADCLADAEDEGVMPLAAPEPEGSSALVNVPRPGDSAGRTVTGSGLATMPEPDAGPGHLDRATDVACPQCGAPVGRSCGPGVFCHAVRVNVWHDSLVPGPTIALELAPETLAHDVPRARTGGRPVTPEQPGPGHLPFVGGCCDDVPPGYLHSHVHDRDCAFADCHGCVPRPPVHAAEKSGSLEAYAQGPGRPTDDLADELAAEAEAHLARHVETHDEWIARMDYEHALWCAETGLVNEWAAA